MKKAYFYLLLATNTSSTSCMEKERPQEVPKYVITTPHTPVTPTYNSQLVSHCQANEPGWEFLDNIADMTYKHEQPINEVELKPIYKPAPTTITQEEKLLIKTIVQTACNRYGFMTQQYLNAYRLADYQRSTKEPDWATLHQKVSFFINDMKAAQKHNVTEDEMGEFAYTEYHRNTTSKYIPLMFALLKRYNCTVNDTKETVPFESDRCYDEKLNCMFGIEKQASNHKSPTSDKELKQYPAYIELINQLKNLLTWAHDSESTVHYLTVCLYENEKIVFSGYSDGSYTNLLHDFYTKTYNMLVCQKVSYLNLYETLLLINKAKELKDIQKETALGCAILNFDPTKCSILEQATHLWNKIDFKIDSKNRIALFCNLIEQYNNNKSVSQKTPTGKQYVCYNAQKNFNLIIPDSITVFDESKYAFADFKTLGNNSANLSASTDYQGMQLCVNKIYYNQ